MKEHPNHPWDHHSDQPHVMRDKKLKRKIYRRAALQMLKSGILLIFLPLIILIQLTLKTWKKTNSNRCIGLSVHVESNCEGKSIVPLKEICNMVDDLGVNQLMVRIPLSDSKNFDTYLNHIDALSNQNREISINLLQDRINIENPDLLKQNLNYLLPRLKNKIKYIHIGNAYNRRKWAFHHFGEYHKFFQTIRSVAKQITPDIKLIGASVIDFEFAPLLESLFHFRRGTYDGYNTQLYVDRRGAPENKQTGFNLLGKINFINLIHKISWKTSGDLWISEINWPLQNTQNFSPCKGSALVSDQAQADYLVRAFLITIASGKVRTCYWHQLIAPGYGLVDNRSDKATKRPSYHAFKVINTLFNNAKTIHFHNGNYQKNKGLYCLKIYSQLEDNPVTIHAFWSHQDLQLIQFSADKWIAQNGDPILHNDPSKIPISSSVIYAIDPR